MLRLNARGSRVVRGDERSEKLPHQTHAVFNLREVLVKFIRRQLALCNEVELVAREHGSRAALRLEFIAPPLQNPDRRARRILVKRLQRIQPLAVARHADRHAGDAL